MKRFNSLLFITISLLLVINSCKKEDDDNNKPKRGTLIESPKLLSTYDEGFLELGLVYFAGNESKNFQINYDIQLYKIKYNTIDADGEPTIASGLLIIPITSKQVPLVSYQHGTILKKTEVPSNLRGDIQPGIILGSEGYVVACPDYIGMGSSPKLHPYLHSKSEATAVIDMLRASKIFCNEKGVNLNNQLFLIGYSQGGHATMAALKSIEEDYSNEFSVTACAPMAGPYDLSGTQLKYILRDTAYPTPGYLAYLIFAYNNVYNIYPDLETLFLSPYYEKFKPFFSDSPTETLTTVDNIWPASKIPSAVLQPDFVTSLKDSDNNPLKVALKQNDLYDWTPKTPLLMCHCDGDNDVSYENSVVALNSFRNKGSINAVLINPFPGADHGKCAVPSFLRAIAWFDSLKK